MANEAVRTARKEHPCASCGRPIRRGETYTQHALAPHEKPNTEGIWKITRYCSTCQPIPDELRADQPCLYSVSGEKCILKVHPSTVPHEFQIGLF